MKNSKNNLTATCPNCTKPQFRYLQPDKHGYPGGRLERKVCPDCGKGCHDIVTIDGIETKHACCHCSASFSTDKVR